MAKGGFNYDSYDLQLDVEVVAEVAGTRNNSDGPKTGTRNQNVWFPPAGMVLEGMWRLNDEANNRPNGALGNAAGGELPGHRLLVDTRKRHVKILHRLTLPENSGKVAALKRLAMTEGFFNARFEQLPKDVDVGPINDADWVNWLHGLRRCVDHGTMKIIKGEDRLPSEDAIRRMGDVTRSAGAYLPKQAEELWKLPKITDKEPVPA